MDIPSPIGILRTGLRDCGRASEELLALDPDVADCPPERTAPLRPHGGIRLTRKHGSTLGCPGEGLARKAAWRTGKSDRRRCWPKVKRGAEPVLACRTQLERVLAIRGVHLRHGALKPCTKAMCQEAFLAFWKWVGRAPPRRVESVPAYDALHSEHVCQALQHGLARGQAGNALSATVPPYPELRGRGKLPESWFLLIRWSRLEFPCRASLGQRASSLTDLPKLQ